MGSNKYIITKIKCWPAFKQDPMSEKLQLTAALCNNFDRSNKFEFCYYGQANSLRLKSNVASKWASKHL